MEASWLGRSTAVRSCGPIRNANPVLSKQQRTVRIRSAEGARFPQPRLSAGGKSVLNYTPNWFIVKGNPVKIPEPSG